MKFETDEEREAFVVKNLRLAHRAASAFQRKYGLLRVDEDDLSQVAVLGMLDAMSDYDPSRAKFSTHAWRKMKKRMIREARASGAVIQLPRTRPADNGSGCRELYDSMSSMRQAKPIDDDMDGRIDPGFENTGIAIDVADALGRLDARSRGAVVAFFWSGDGGVSRFAAAAGISDQRVYQIKDDAVKSLAFLLRSYKESA